MLGTVLASCPMRLEIPEYYAWQLLRGLQSNPFKATSVYGGLKGIVDYLPVRGSYVYAG